MDLTLTNIIYFVALPCLAWGFQKFIINRIEQIEQKVDTMVNEPQVRQIVTDKIDPIQSDIKEIKADIRNLFLLQINDKLNTKDLKSE